MTGSASSSAGRLASTTFAPASCGTRRRGRSNSVTAGRSHRRLFGTSSPPFPTKNLMLEPQSRRHLLEALRPPPGYALDCAIGTTFSLDLLTMLTAPLAFTLFDWEDEGGHPTADPLALLE